LVDGLKLDLDNIIINGLYSLIFVNALSSAIGML